MRVLHTVCIAVVAVALTVGCRNTRKDEFVLPGQTELEIESFAIRGVTKVSVGELKSGLATRQSRWTSAKSVRWVPVLGTEKQYFNYVQWAADLERIRTYYYARGYFDAKVVSENIVENPAEKTVRISITVSEGEPTHVATVSIEGIERVERGERLKAGLALVEGEIFSEADYLAARQQIDVELDRLGYAYAEVEGRVVVDARTRKADVVFYVDPGPLAEFGEVVVQGMDSVPESAIRQALTFKPGERYSPEKMQESQERIYDLGVFAIVKVIAQTESEEPEEESAPAPEVVEEEFDLGGLGELLDQAQQEATRRAELDPAVPVLVQVKEAKLWNVRVGAGVAAESARQEVHGRLDWSSRNFFGGLRRLEHFNSAGYAWAPSVFRGADERDEGVIVDSELRFQQPRFIERFTTLDAQLRFSRQVELGYTLTSPAAKLGVRRRFFRVLSTELSYNVALFQLTGLPEALKDPALRLQPQYVLEFFEQRAALDYRNDFFNPTRGWLLEAQLQEAAPYFGQLLGAGFRERFANFIYFVPTLSGEIYVPMWGHSLALRTRASTIYRLSEERPPIPQRLYAGGADSMRAFGRQRLSLYSLSGEAIPIGGLTKFEASVEPRLRLVRNMGGVGDFWVGPFFDAATVLHGPLFHQTEQELAPAQALSDVTGSLLYGVGAGMWWVTPVGPVRLDVAYRLSDIRDDERFRRCAVEPNVAGTCNAGFVPIDEDPVFEEVKSPWNVILGIGHSF